MPAPIQPVTSFAEAELWYMYQQLTEINTNTSGGGGGLSQTEVFEIFNGTNPQGLALSLFESLSGNNISLADLVETGNGKLSSINTNTGNAVTTLSNIDGTTQTIEAYSQNIQNNTLSIDTKLTNVATTTLQTTGNNSLASIDTKVSTAANQTTANASLSSIDTKLTTETTNTTNISTYLSTLRTPVIISTSASATISGQLHNISIYNSGSATGTITVNGTTINLPTGVTVNYDAGGNNNRFPTNSFGYNATGTTFLISYVN